ncbi:hypothetical protein NL676_017999 [Syzygium grande]|nr:hypothetical protein NL676_017999 [Syzygium grande]
MGWRGAGGELIGYLGGTATDFSKDDLLEAIDALAVFGSGVPRQRRQARCSRGQQRRRRRRRRGWRVDGEEEEEQGRRQEEECGGP